MAQQHPSFRNSRQNGRIRKKLQSLGPEALTDQDLLAIVLARGCRGESAGTVADRVLQLFRAGAFPRCCSVDTLRDLCQLGSQHASQILACFELGKRFFDRMDGIRLCTPDAVYDHLRSMGRLNKEAFRGLYLDIRNQLVHDEIVSLGTLTMNLVHPREVFRPAIEHSAAGIILVHNHPSGDPTPSAEDLKVTRQLMEVGRLLDIEVLDHVIIARDAFVSLRRKGFLGAQ
jgi:DNA repair protein RadC